MSTYNPDNWLISLQRSVKGVIEAEIDGYVLDDNNQPAGASVFEVVFEWPEADDLAISAEFAKTIVHFIIDDINNMKLGFGNDVVAGLETVGVGGNPDLVNEQTAQCHEVNFDVGVWASDSSGGVTSRLVVYQMLQRLLSSQAGREKFKELTGGVEVRHFNGGRFIVDRVNDIRVFRIIDCELVVRVYSRVIGGQLTIVDEEPVQQPGILIEDQVII